jgi:iron complex outermembrane receptor protein
MSYKKVALFGAAATIALFTSQAGAAVAAETAAGQTAVTEVIVTANKRQENIQNVGMSIQAASGDKLTKLGITDTASLAKIVPGFEVTPNYYGTVVYTIRGVGFQDTSLAGSPTVTVYLDEIPLPFSILTAGASLDLQRVEVLKGPQGTLFGDNATAGAINYIANKPTDTFQAGMDLTYGRFSDVNVQGFVSGPIAENLDARLALQSHTSGAWQKGYGPQEGQTTGGQDFLNGRISLLWKPTDKFKALLTVSGFQDKGYNQVGQLAGLAGGRNHFMPQILQDYPLAPHTNEAAGWMECVNTSPFDPVTGQEGGDQYLVGTYPDGRVASGLAPAGFHYGDLGPNVRAESESNDPAHASVLQGAHPTHCQPMRRNNDFYDISLRMDYDLPMGMTATSLTSWDRFNRNAKIDGAGVAEQDYQSWQVGKIEDIYQELRVSGKFWGNKGNWIVGGNFQYDNSWDRFMQTYNGSTASPTGLPFAGLCAAFGGCTPEQTLGSPSYNATLYPQSIILTLGPTMPSDFQIRHTYSVFGHLEYPILDNLTLLGGVRYTEADLTGGTCGADSGDGSWANVAENISNLLEVLSGTTSLQQYINPTATGGAGFHPADGSNLQSGGYGVNVGPSGCGTTGSGPYFRSFGSANVPLSSRFPGGTLNQHNIAWTAGLNWKVTPTTLLYFTVSQGYKGGSFPTVAMSSAAQANPVHQENLIAYEGGFKGSWFDHQITLNGAGFYYDYTDKQILGAETDPIFGPLATLVNVPKSHVYGFELSGVITPGFLHGLTITPAVSMQHSQIDKCPGTASAFGSCINGHYITPDAFSKPVDIFGQSFPSAPEWQASVDAEYDWKIMNDINAFIGLNVQYNGKTHTGFQDPHPPVQPATYNPGDTCGANVLCYDNSNVPAYTLLDLRAGIEKDAWRFQVWAHNVTNAYYYTANDRVNDTILRYTGMPQTYGFTLSYRYH